MSVLKTFLQSAVEVAVENFPHYQMITETLVLLDQFVTEEEEGCSWEGVFVLEEEEKVVMNFLEDKERERKVTLLVIEGEEERKGLSVVEEEEEEEERGRKVTLLVIEDEEERKGLSVVEEEEEEERKGLEVQKERDQYGKCQGLLVSLVVLPKQIPSAAVLADVFQQFSSL